MICPKCGAKLDEEKLYCQVCGTEIVFVPDYEPEIEQSITETLSELQFIDMDGDFVDGSFENQDHTVYDDFDENYTDYDNGYDPAYSENVEQNISDYNQYDYTNTNSAYSDNEYYNADGADRIYSQKTEQNNTIKKAVNPNASSTNKGQGVNKKNTDAAPKKTASKNSTTSYKTSNTNTHKKSISDKIEEKDRLRRRKASLSYLKKDVEAPKFSHGLSDSLYYEMPSEEELEYFDKEYQIDPFDDFAYESYFFKQFIKLFKNKKIAPLLIIGLIVIIGGAIFGVSKISKSIYEANSYEYQIELAKEAASNGNYESAISYMEKAITLNSSDTSIKYTLADYYFENGDDDSAILLLWEIIDADDINKPYAYRKIIEYYAAKDDFGMVQTVLSSCDDENIRSSFIDYTADTVTYSMEEGTYEEEIYVSLESNAKGTIYYTTDGTEPTTDSPVYTEPLYMDIGIYRVSTLFVNNYGVQSDIVTKTYTIDIRVPNPPVILTEGGDYEEPKLIEVDVQPYCTVYYTLDGSIPDMYSEEYLSPIPMPIGSSHIIFIAYSQEGVPGEISEVEYNLTLDTDIELQAFINCLNICNFNIGRAIDIDGHLAGNSTVYQFQVSQAIMFDEAIYYVFVETLVDSFGNVTKTGNLYLGNIKTGEIYGASKDEEGVISVNQIIDPILFTIMYPERLPSSEPTEAVN